MARPSKQESSNSGTRVYVYSTLANDQRYTEWHDSGNDLPIEGRGVFIKGGTGVANDRLITPIGVMTEIDESELAILEKCPIFNMHRKNGFVTVEKSKVDAEKVAADLSLEDASAPMTPSDYKDGNVNVLE